MQRKDALLLLALAAAAPASQAQTGQWPQKSVRIIVPLAPGGSVDIIARIVAARLSDKFGQQFIVDNRPGAGSTIGVAIATRANPDGYTLLMMSPAFAASAALYKLPYDPIKEIAPVVMIATGSMFLAVNPSVKAANVKEFIELARANPGALKYGSGGMGSSTHLATELFQQMTRIDVIHIPYKGIGPALADLLGGQIQFYIAPGAALVPHTNTAKLRLLAVTGEQRSPEMPDLPAIAEAVPGYSATFWYGLGAPAGTPRQIITTLNQEIARLLKQPDLVKRLRTYDLDPAHSAPEAFARRIAHDIVMWSRVVKAGNIKLE
ncbi:MAG TPA: tripartite tricarboxylate transporter substrate binding protein [Burkholderiales bacterium]|nr:tripartite tricarboxylate transporter substrate binding protein [Burkholderiales bacterium]